MNFVAALLEQTVEASGFPHVRASRLMRYLQVESLMPVIPAHERSRGGVTPQIDAVHGTVWLLALLNPGPNLQVAASVRAFWNARAFYREPLEDFDPTRQFGPEIMAHINPAIDAPLRDVPSRERDPLEIQVKLGPTWARLKYRNGDEQAFRGEDFARYARPSPRLAGRTPIETITTAGYGLLLEIADVVAASRAEAKRLGVEIPTEETWRALGDTPPDEPPSSTSGPDNNPGPENAEDQKGASPDEPLRNPGQPAKKQTASLTNLQCSESEIGHQPASHVGRPSQLDGERYARDAA